MHFCLNAYYDFLQLSHLLAPTFASSGLLCRDALCTPSLRLSLLLPTDVAIVDRDTFLFLVAIEIHTSPAS